MKEIQWMEEVINDVPTKKGLFKFFKFILGKRKTGLTYKDLYIIYTHIYNFKGVDETKLKEKAIEHLIEIYYYNNHKLPE